MSSAWSRTGADEGVHVWRVGLDIGPVGVTALPDERERGDRMRDERRRARFLASRAWLRVILGGYLGVDADTLRFTQADRGKPSVLDGGNLCFSLSRSAGVALVAVTRGRAVGVDVERIRADADHDAVAERFFSPVEAGALSRLCEPARRDAFFDLWVRKEAVVKATGAGIADGLRHVEVSAGMFADRWSVGSLATGPGYAAAVAVAVGPGPLGEQERAAAAFGPHAGRVHSVATDPGGTLGLALAAMRTHPEP